MTALLIIALLLQIVLTITAVGVAREYIRDRRVGETFAVLALGCVTAWTAWHLLLEAAA